MIPTQNSFRAKIAKARKDRQAFLRLCGSLRALRETPHRDGDTHERRFGALLLRHEGSEGEFRAKTQRR